MKKHAAGFVFFVMIVALFAVGYAVVRTSAIPDIEVVNEPVSDPPRYAFPHNEAGNVRVTQAIADPIAKSLAFTLSGLGSDVNEVEFAFYNVNSEGVRFVRDEVVNIRLDQWSSGAASGVIKYKTDWLGSRQITDNLYVVAIARSSKRTSNGVVPFSMENATAVLIAKN